MEYNGQDLDQLLKEKTNINERNLVRIVYNTLCSLSYMHINNILHRDLKPANILVDDDFNVKICDLGLSRCLPRGCDTFKSDEQQTYEI